MCKPSFCSLENAQQDRVTVEAIAEVASACPSSGWLLGVVGVHNWQLGLFPERAQEEVWGDDWSFSSGCDHCDWVFLGGIAPSHGGPPDMRTFLMPRSDYEIVDNWHVAGLAGTGSKDIAPPSCPPAS
jgi:3-hydroxy-9,10-secoandrosta-1,3,5(10)-triene-9,17-dione monooxygenase